MYRDKHKRINKTLKKWKIGDYIRQTSIVVAGVMVTFIGGNIISERSTNKEIHSIMQLMKEELQYNIEELQSIDSKISKDITMSNYINKVNLEIDSIPADTLQKYKSLISLLSSFEFKSTAFEVFKNSSLMQKVSDKSMLIDITNAYESLRYTKLRVQDYYDIKGKNIYDMIFSRDEEAIQKMNSDIYTSYKTAFKNKSMRNMLGVTPGFLNNDFFDRHKSIIRKGIESIEQNYN